MKRTSATVKIGDNVDYYCYTNMIHKTGQVTRVNVLVKWARRTHTKKMTHPFGYQINGNLTRPYDNESYSSIS